MCLLPDLPFCKLMEQVEASVAAAGKTLSAQAMVLGAAALSEERRQCVYVPDSMLQILLQRGITLVWH